ncbi:MAG: DUF1566 domain-containing protein [Deltaproteobacteria bacterium]
MKRILGAMLVIAVMTVIGAATGQAADDRFVVHHGNQTVWDSRTNLMWAIKDNGSDISWTGAKSYCENYQAGGYRDWRLPTNDELASLYHADKTFPAPCAGNFNIHVVTDLIKLTCFAAWSSGMRGTDAAHYNFVYGQEFWYLQSHTYGMRALPVRSGK